MGRLFSEDLGGIGDEMHELSDAQIRKLVLLRFNNDPLLLIRQLSRDVSSKEKQLILLRNDKFQREQELKRLCSEYSNLTTLEIEARLKPTLNNPEKALGDMVGFAASEAFETDGFEARGLKAEGRNDLPEKDKREKGMWGRGAKEKELPPEKSGKEPASPEVDTLRSSTSESHSSLRTYWLGWMNNSEESVSRKVLEPKPAVELEKFVQAEFFVESDGVTDRHGFYLNSPMKAESRAKEDGEKKLALEAPHEALNNKAPRTESLNRLAQSMDILKQLGKMHDVESKNILLRWDTFMAQISDDRRKAQSKVDIPDTSLFGFKGSILKLSDTGWARYFANKNLESTDAAKKFRNLQNLIHEDGIPPVYRNLLWAELSGSKDVAVPGEYARLLAESHKPSSKIRESIDQINLDLHRTLPSNKFFHDAASSLPGPQLAKLKRILYALAVYMPDIGYSQGMNKIVGNLLLGVSESNATGTLKLEEEDVFWTFVAFINDVIPSYNSRAYFDSKSIPAIQNEIAMTVNVFMKRFVPKLHAHFESLGVDVEIVLHGWWLGIFSECTTGVEAWFKFVDNLLIAEHSDRKFVAYTIAILRVHEQILVECAAADEVYSFVSRLKLGAVTNVRFRDLNKECLSIETQISAQELAELRTAALTSEDVRLKSA